MAKPRTAATANVTQADATWWLLPSWLDPSESHLFDWRTPKRSLSSTDEWSNVDNIIPQIYGTRTVCAYKKWITWLTRSSNWSHYLQLLLHEKERVRERAQSAGPLLVTLSAHLPPQSQLISYKPCPQGTPGILRSCRWWGPISPCNNTDSAVRRISAITMGRATILSLPIP